LNSEKRLRWRRRIIWAGFTIFAVPACASIFSKGALIDQVPLALQAAGLAIGTLPAFAVAAFSRALINEPPWQITKMMLSLLIFGLFLGSYDARLAYEFAAFENYPARAGKMLFQITSSSSGRGGPMVYARAADDARVLQLYSVRRLQENVGDVRTVGRDCLLLNIEVGRWGVRRAIVPRRLDPPVDLDRWRRCPDYEADR
jgi:hypothetical protein